MPLPVATSLPAALPSLMDDGDFLNELDKIEMSVPRPQPVSRPPFWGAAPHVVPPADEAESDDPEQDGLAATYSWPEPVAPESAPGPARAVGDQVPRRLAALVVLVGMCSGAGSAAFVFHDRVEQIVAAWTVARR